MEQSKISAPLLVTDLGMMYANPTSKNKTRYGIYKCECGTEFKAMTVHINNGHTKSCGCFQKRVLSEIRTIHKSSQHPLYSTWNGMLQRTLNPKSLSYHRYGARGITVCIRWLKIENFIEDMYSTYKEGFTLDREDNDKGYSPDNCRWANNETQARNTKVLRSNNTSGYRGVNFKKASGKWQSQITVNKKTLFIGSFSTALEAAKAYDSYVIANNLEHTINGVLNEKDN